jgi:acetolactate synthase-1/2/3 large subunit
MEEGLRNGQGHRLMKEARAGSAFEVPDFQTDVDFRIPPHRAVADLQEAMGAEARFVTDIGEHMLFALHYLTARGPQDFHIQLNLGSMGSGIAGAAGLALADRERPVVCICGDGGMQMSGMEILTSLKMRLPVLYAVFNDSRYNMVHHGMKQLFGHAEAYDTPSIDFSAWARAMGIPAVTIRQGGEINSSLVSELLATGGPALLDIHIDREVRLRGGGRVEALQHMSVLTQHAQGGTQS